MPANRTPLLLIAALALWPAAHAHAQDSHDTFSIRISGYINRFNTTVKVDGDTRQGTPVNLQHDLGLDDNNPVANIGLTWRPREHHEFGLNYYNKDADKTQVLDGISISRIPTTRPAAPFAPLSMSIVTRPITSGGPPRTTPGRSVRAWVWSGIASTWG